MRGEAENSSVGSAQRVGILIPAQAATPAARGRESLPSSLLPKPLVAPEPVSQTLRAGYERSCLTPRFSAGLSHLRSAKHINFQANFQSRICSTHSRYGRGRVSFRNGSQCSSSTAAHKRQENHPSAL